jgi:murein DD-endopeptidase MepM/ murein hydrolase activator NlpD
LDYISPDNTSNHGCVARKEVISRNPWLILCGIILCVATAIGSVFAFHFIQESNAHISFSLVDKKIFQQAFRANFATNTAFNEDRGLCLATNTTTSSVPVKLAIVVKFKNDNLSKVFKRFGIKDVNAVTNILKLKKAYALNNLRPGHKLSLLVDPTRTKIQSLTYDIDNLNTLVVTLVNNRWQVKEHHIEPTSTVKYVAATISGSIYAAGKQAGIPRKLIAQVVDVLNYKVNVNKLRSGDKLALFYREYELINGKKVRDSEIVAVELAQAGKMHHIVSFTDPHGHTNFYTPDGHNIKPSFVRYPISFRKITAGFSFSRFHPILGFTRPHLGVDFAARVGTPVKATSNGKVEFAGRKGGYGKTIIIRNGIYSTLYAHLSKFAKNMYSGRYVKQGEIVGYAGASGLATGSHLHYEFRINGVHYDPLKVKLPSGEMIAREYRGRFFALSKRMVAKLDLYRKTNRVFAMYSGVKVE